MAYLANAIYEADPEAWGIGEKFNLDSSVIKSDVLKSTGERPGTVTINGRSINLSGPTVPSYWAKNGAPTTSYRFGIGASDADYQKAWGAILGGYTSNSGSNFSSNPNSNNGTNSSSNRQGN